MHEQVDLDAHLDEELRRAKEELEQLYARFASEETLWAHWDPDDHE